VPRAMTTSVAVAACVVGALSGPAAGVSDEKQSHGKFTGDLKAVLYVSDVEKSAPYYRDVFGFGFEGFAELNGNTYYAEMTAAEVKFGLHEPTARGDEARVGRQRLYFRVQDVAVHHERIAAWDGHPGPIRHTDWMDMFTATDRDGNEIVFASTDPARHSIDPWRRQPGDRSSRED
jgi:predicted enzyme related to lactoylglutathione lyase